MSYKGGDVVWVKCGALFWPAEIVEFDKLPADIREDFDAKKRPKVVAKFFDEDGYEFLFNENNLFPYNCKRKEEFIKKGVVKSRTKVKEGATSGWFAKFPTDVVRSEKLTGGDVHILDKEPYVEKQERVNYKELFGTPQPEKKKKGDNKRKAESIQSPSNKKAKSGAGNKKATTTKQQPPRPIVHPRFRPGGGGAENQHQVKIMQQPSTPYHLDLQMKQEKTAAAAPGAYTCHICGFTASRLNVIVLHNKSHSEPAKGSSTQPRGIIKTPSTPAPSTPAASTTRGRGRPPASKKAASAATPSSASKNKTPKETASSAAVKRETPSRRGKKKEEVSIPPPAKSKATKAAAVAASPAKERKPRMTKKKKDQLAQEQEKKREERKQILGEWDEEEEGEAEEKKKIKETLGGDKWDSDTSDEEDEQEAYFQEDNVQGNVYGDEEEEEEEAEEVEKEVEKEKEESNATNGELKEKTKIAKKAEDEVVDIGKVLEETKVPELPDLGSAGKKSVKFSAQVAKEIAITKIPLMQQETNMVNPMEIDDEFAFAEEPRQLQPDLCTKTILKQNRSSRRAKSPPPPPNNNAQESKQANISTSGLCKEQKPTETWSEETAGAKEGQQPMDEHVDKPQAFESNPVESTGVAQASQGAESKSSTSGDSDLLTAESAAAATMVALGSGTQQQQQVIFADDGGTHQTDAGASGNSQEETYILLVDDGSGAQLDQLNSQTLYIDSNSLANGDLSNMVLMTSPPEQQRQQQQVQQVEETTHNNGHTETSEASAANANLLTVAMAASEQHSGAKSVPVTDSTPQSM